MISGPVMLGTSVVTAAVMRAIAGHNAGVSALVGPVSIIKITPKFVHNFKIYSLIG